MRFAKTSSIALALIVGAASLLTTTTSASAYPAGQNLTLNLDRTTVLDPSTVIHGTVSHVKPGCVVTVRIVQTEITGRLLTAGVDGNVSQFSIQTPSAYGVYTIKASTSSACVGYKESDSATLIVGKATTITSSLSTRNGLVTVKSKPVFVITGTLKYGSANVKNAIVWAQLTRPNGSKSAKYQTRTNASGAFSFSMTGLGTLVGSYSAKVSFSGAGAYIASSDVSNSVTLTTPVR